MKARGLLLVLALGWGCATPYEARRAPLGQPSTPALRAAGVLTDASVVEPGWTSQGNGTWVRRVVTPAGTVVRDRRVGPGPVDAVVQIDVRVQAGPDGRGIGVLNMAWTEPSVPPCEGTNLATDILVVREGDDPYGLVDERRVRWERPVVLRGERIVSGRFGDNPGLLLRPSVVDVQLVAPHGAERRETCVRVPVTGPDVTYWNRKTWAWGARLEWRRSFAFASAGALAVGPSIARWVGPLRFALHGTLGAGAEPSEDFMVAGFGLEAGGLAWRWTSLALGWSLTYEALFAYFERSDLPDPPQGRRASSGGPRLGIQILRASPQIMSTSRFSPTDAWGLEVFGAAAQLWSGAASGSPVTFGVALLGF